jgi:hypothetical protein
LETLEESMVNSSLKTQQSYSAVDLMRLPLKVRLRILASSSRKAEEIYKRDKRLTDFEAFGANDLYDETP